MTPKYSLGEYLLLFGAIVLWLPVFVGMGFLVAVFWVKDRVFNDF